MAVGQSPNLSNHTHTTDVVLYDKVVTVESELVSYQAFLYCCG